jgi:GPH family glycoside/pentoside/hexuronide:cation symporter
MNKQTNVLASTKKEKVFYAFGDVGANMIWSFSSAFLTLYYTDSVGLAAAFAGTMMLVCRMFDGISDIVMGIIIDKTRSKWGKARSWLLFSIVPLALAFFAAYNVPSALGTSAKNTYAFITYFLLSVVCYTANNIAYHSMLPRFSLTSTDRSIVSVVRTIFNMVALLGINILTPILLTRFGGENKQGAWTIITFIYGGFAVAALFITFFGVKEKLSVDQENSNKVKEKSPIKESLKILVSSRYFYIAMMLFFTFYITGGSQGVGIYYARDVLGNANIFGLMTIASILPTLVMMPLVPLLFKKLGKRNAMMIGLALSIIAYTVLLIDPRNTVLYLCLLAVRSLGTLPTLVAAFTLAGDIVDYNDMKTGIRAEGITTAVNSIGSKLGTGLGSGLLGWFLAWGKYDGALAVQPDSAISSMIILAVIIPLCVFITAFVLLIFWDLDKYSGAVQKYLEEKQKANEIKN